MEKGEVHPAVNSNNFPGACPKDALPTVWVQMSVQAQARGRCVATPLTPLLMDATHPCDGI